MPYTASRREYFHLGLCSVVVLHETVNRAMRQISSNTSKVAATNQDLGRVSSIYLGIEISRNTLVGEKNEATVPTISVVGKLKHVKPIQLADCEGFPIFCVIITHYDATADLFLKERIDPSKNEVVKVAIPSPTMVRHSILSVF